MKRVLVLTSLSIFSAATLPGADATTSSWPQWRGPERSGLSAETGLSKDWETHPPQLIWTAEGLGQGYASVSIANGRIYTSGNLQDGQAIIALNAKDGAIEWITKVTDTPPKHGYGGSRTTPTIDGERLYVVPSNGSIVCLKASDGSIAWRKDFSKEWKGQMMSGWGFSESPLVDGDLVLCTPGANEAMIVALNKLTGDEVWRSAVPEFGTGQTRDGKPVKQGAAYSSIVISHAAGVKQYVQFVGQGVIGVRASDGKFLWGYEGVANKTANIPTPITSGDYVFTSSGYGTGSALLKLSKAGDGVKAEEVYFLDASTLQNHHGGMLLIDGHVYCGHAHNNGFPICVEMATGDVKWGGKIRGVGKGSAAVTFADGHIVFCYESGELSLVEATPDEYRLKGSLTPDFQQGKSWAHPVILGGRLYLREQDKLMCYDIRSKS